LLKSHFNITGNKKLALVKYPIARQEMQVVLHEVIYGFTSTGSIIPLPLSGAV